jgi:ketosteroid isomerase-like protein
MKRVLMYSLCGIIAGLSLFACKPAAPVALGETDKAAIRKVLDNALTIAASGDWAAYDKAYYAEDAKVLEPNMPIVEGRAAMESGFLKSPPISNFKAEIFEIEGYQDLAYVRGKYSMTITLPGTTEPINDVGKYIEIWRKQADGSWKVIRDIFNSDLPLPAPEKTEEKKK